MSAVETMFGLHGLGRLTIANYLTWPVWIALIVAIIGAGPLIPWLSRWRVSVDAVTASLVMMLTSTSIFIWRSVLRRGRSG